MRLQSLFGIVLTAIVFVHAAPISSSEIEINAAKGLRLISVEEGVKPVWKTEEETLDLVRAKIQFVSSPQYSPFIDQT